MTECRTGSTFNDDAPLQLRCPVNGRQYRRVGLRTILHQLDAPWKRQLPDCAYYFCTDPACDVVYFSANGERIRGHELRNTAGVKEKGPERMICYCFGITYAVAERDPTAMAFVRDQTRRSRCACETSNPSGRCCLKDFPAH